MSPQVPQKIQPRFSSFASVQRGNQEELHAGTAETAEFNYSRDHSQNTMQIMNFEDLNSPQLITYIPEEATLISDLKEQNSAQNELISQMTMHIT
jgi:hypothetical protein